jgi:hypothetical protein
MNNRPVAWIGETLMGRQYINGQKGILPVGTPLYISPDCPTKTLSDEEILRIADSIVINDRTLGNFSIDFARAILRKAQE